MILFGYGTVSLAVVLLILRQTFDRTVLATKFSSNERHSARQPGGSSAAGSGGSTFTAKLPLSPGSAVRPFSPPFTPPSSDHFHDSIYGPSQGQFEMGSPIRREGGWGQGQLGRGGVGREATDPRPLLDVPRGYSTYSAPGGGQGQGQGRVVEELEGSAGSHASWESRGLPPGARRE